jgi:hypothetical protein
MEHMGMGILLVYIRYVKKTYGYVANSIHPGWFLPAIEPCKAYDAIENANGLLEPAPNFAMWFILLLMVEDKPDMCIYIIMRLPLYKYIQLRSIPYHCIPFHTIVYHCIPSHTITCNYITYIHIIYIYIYTLVYTYM